MRVGSRYYQCIYKYKESNFSLVNMAVQNDTKATMGYTV